DTETFALADPPAVGRDYHSGGLLLPDGSVLTFGGNPLFSDKNDQTPAPFERRLELYTPPYLYPGARPVIAARPTTVHPGTTGLFAIGAGTDAAAARLLRPGASTHVTDVSQRSIALDVAHVPGGVRLSFPSQAGLVPPGWYMLFVVNSRGVPSVARWVQVA